MDHKLSVKCNPMKSVDDNIGKYICDLVGKRFARRQIV